MIKWKRLLVGASIFYPISWVIQSLAGIPIFDLYNEVLYVAYEVIYEWWDWILISIATFMSSKNIIEVKYETMELIRRNRFFSEIERWANTPYVPPILFFYLINPPQSVSSKIEKTIDNRFYQMIINFFRDRIYINAEYQSDTPYERLPLWRVIGIKELVKTILIYTIVFFWFSSVCFTDLSNWINGWERFTLPAVIYFSLYIAMKMQAYFDMTYAKMDRVLTQTFSQPEPLVRWRELFIDHHRGQTVLAAWEAEREKRQRYTDLYRNGFVPDTITHFTNPALAPYPYPYRELPTWIDDMDAHYQQKLLEWEKQKVVKNQMRKKKKNNGNIIDFQSKRKPS
ncbi:hypothetical protein [Metabacillus fastidiosus]|uniref:Uncharacterized protein n=1 Tax=Metabacillus fastidiosus TaxID=1458 RepID=A0ABU6NT08_9BACI|nr:hypothetical protein [Metabacillus fastidiosus]